MVIVKEVAPFHPFQMCDMSDCAGMFSAKPCRGLIITSQASVMDGQLQNELRRRRES